MPDPYHRQRRQPQGQDRDLEDDVEVHLDREAERQRRRDDAQRAISAIFGRDRGQQSTGERRRPAGVVELFPGRLESRKRKRPDSTGATVSPEEIICATLLTLDPLGPVSNTHFFHHVISRTQDLPFETTTSDYQAQHEAAVKDWMKANKFGHQCVQCYDTLNVQCDGNIPCQYCTDHCYICSITECSFGRACHRRRTSRGCPSVHPDFLRAVRGSIDHRRLGAGQDEFEAWFDYRRWQLPTDQFLYLPEAWRPRHKFSLPPPNSNEQLPEDNHGVGAYRFGYPRGEKPLWLLNLTSRDLFEAEYTRQRAESKHVSRTRYYQQNSGSGLLAASTPEKALAGGLQLPDAVCRLLGHQSDSQFRADDPDVYRRVLARHGKRLVVPMELASTASRAHDQADGEIWADRVRTPFGEPSRKRRKRSSSFEEEGEAEGDGGPSRELPRFED